MRRMLGNKANIITTVVLLTSTASVTPVPSTAAIATATAAPTSAPSVASPVVLRPLPALHGKDHRNLQTTQCREHILQEKLLRF